MQEVTVLQVLEIAGLKCRAARSPSSTVPEPIATKTHVDQVLRDNPSRRCGSDSRWASVFRIAALGSLASAFAFCLLGYGNSPAIAGQAALQLTLTLSLSECVPRSLDHYDMPSHAKA